MVRNIIFLILALLLVSTNGWAQSCINYSDYLRGISSTELPQEEGQYPRVSDITARGDTLIMTTSYLGLVSAAVRVDGTVYVLSQTPTWSGNPKALATRNNLLYVADGTAGLQIFDIADAASPQWLAHIDTPGDAVDVEVTPGIALILDSFMGVVAIDTHEVRSPRIVGSLSLPGLPTSMAPCGDILFVACGEGGLAIVDISSPETPRLMGIQEFPNRVNDIAVNENILALTQFIDYGSDNYEPKIQFYKIDGSLPLLSLESELSMLRGESHSMVFHQDLLLVSGFEYGIKIINTSVVSQPFVQGYYYSDSADSAESASTIIVGDYLVAAYRFIELLDFELNTCAPLLGTISQEEGTRAIAVNGHYTYTAGSDPRLQIADISNLSAPEVAVALPSGTSSCISINDGVLYLGSYHDDVEIYNLDDPMNPVLTKQLQGTAGAISLFFDGGMMVLVRDRSFSLFFMNSFGEPYLVSETAITDGSHADIQGDYLYLAGGYSGGLRVYNISDPWDPALVFIDDINSVSPVGVFTDGDYLYTSNSNYSEGFQVFDISNPEVPDLISSLPIKSSRKPIIVSNGIAYTCPSGGPIKVINVQNPYNPHLLGTLGYHYYYTDLAMDYNRLFIQGSDSGVEIGSLQCFALSAVPTVPDFEQAIPMTVYPNPFNPRTNIEWVNPQTVSQQVAVYDLAGHRVALLADKVFLAGVHTLQWDGVDDAGAAMPSGVYLVSIRSFGTLTSKRISLVR